MALVYRTVPSFFKTLEKFNKLNKDQENLESIFYDLGYVSFEGGYSFFKRNDRKVNTFPLVDENFKFFFLYPSDALLSTFSSMDPNCYDTTSFYLLEYNIPDHILNNYIGYGFYNGNAIIEFRIPEKVFEECMEGKISHLHELDQYKEKYHISSLNSKRIYKVNFITRKSILINTDELYNEKGILSYKDIINLLNKKGIIENFEPTKNVKKKNDVLNDLDNNILSLKK